jgi:hypothetical protein
LETRSCGILLVLVVLLVLENPCKIEDEDENDDEDERLNRVSKQALRAIRVLIRSPDLIH